MAPFTGSRTPTITAPTTPPAETNPNDNDSDGDTLLDGVEDANHKGVVEPARGETDPRKADTDGDRLNDNVELDNGTDPNNPDSDGDGIPDGQDPKSIQNAVNALSTAVLNDAGNKTAFLSALDDINKLIAARRDRARGAARSRPLAR